MIKMLCVDLDGTLLDSNQIISPKNMLHIQQVLDKGITVYFVTGRPYCFAKYWALKIDKRIQVIASNGGVYELEGNVISQCIPSAMLKETISILATSNSHAFFKGLHVFYTKEPYDKRFLYSHMEDIPEEIAVCSFTDLSWEELTAVVTSIDKILIHTDSPEELIVIRNRLEEVKELSITCYNAISLDINAKYVSKGSTICKVLGHHGWNSSHVMAIGDSENDRSMFEVSGVKVAMGNATKEICVLSDMISKTNDEDGVAHAISQYILKEELIK